MGDAPQSRRKAYASTAMRDRKDRILSETRRLIAAGDPTSLQLSEIADAAGVAINTLYRAYGRREELIVHAVLEGFATCGDRGEQAAPTLAANLHRLNRTAAYFRMHRNELAGLISIYFSASTSAELRLLIDAPSRHANEGWAKASTRGLNAIDPASLADLLTRWEFATLFDWSIDRLSDELALTELTQGHLRLLSTLSRGEVRDDVMSRLKRRIPRASGGAYAPIVRPAAGLSVVS